MTKRFFANIFVNHAKAILLLFIIASCAAAWGLQYFRIDASADTLLVKNNELYIKTQIMNKRFAPNEFILVAYEPTTHDLFSNQTFADIQQLSRALAELERVQSVTSMLSVPLLSQIDSLQGDIDPQQWTWQNKQYAPVVMRDIFTDHPLFTDLLVNKKQSATALQIVFRPNEELQAIDNEIVSIQQHALERDLTEEENQRIETLKQQADPLQQSLTKLRAKEIEQIYSIIKPYEERAQFYLGGSYVLGQQLIDIITQDLVLFGSAIGGAICLLLFVFFGKFRWVILPVICCGVSVLLTMGLFGFFDLRTTVISSNFIAMQLILTLAIVIHLIVEFRQFAAQDNEEELDVLLKKTLEHKFKPCLYAGITTSVGFASLLFSGIQPVVSFGWMMIVATAISILSSLMLFPAILSLFSHRESKSDSKLSDYFIALFTRLTLNAGTLIIVLAIAVTALAGVGLMRLDVENSFLDYFDDSTTVHKELTFIDQEFGGSTPMDLVYDIPQKNEKTDVVLSADTLQTLQKIQHVLKQYEATGNVTSIVNFTDLAKQINDGQPITEYELSAIYTLLDESLREKLLGAYYSDEFNQLRISTRIQDSTEGLDRQEFINTIHSDMEALGLSKENYSLTNLFVLYQDILQRLFKSQILTLGLVYIALTVVLLLIFRSIKVALIAVIPNIITTLAILGIMGWLRIPLDLMTITIAAIAMGIAVDDTIHFVHRYLEHKSDAQTATRKTFNSVGYALFYTTTVITIGFSLLSFSDFVPSVLFGLLTGTAMVMALVTDSTLLPVLLNKFVADKRH